MHRRRRRSRRTGAFMPASRRWSWRSLCRCAPSSCPCWGFPPRSRRCWRACCSRAARKCLILAVALLGKDTFRYFAHRVMTALRRAVIDQPASKARYYTGLVVILLSWLPAYIYAYSPTLMPGGDARIYVLAAMDLAFVVSVFLIGENSGKGQPHLRLRRPDLNSAPDRFHREIRALASRFRRSYPFAARPRTNVGTERG